VAIYDPIIYLKTEKIELFQRQMCTSSDQPRPCIYGLLQWINCSIINLILPQMKGLLIQVIHRLLLHVEYMLFFANDDRVLVLASIE